jgi:hypothetical protein
MFAGPTGSGLEDSPPPGAVDHDRLVMELIRARVERELEPGEHLLWVGRAQPPRASLRWWPLLAVLLPIAAGRLFFVYPHILTGLALGVTFWFACGAVVVAMLSWRDRRRLRHLGRVAYAVTDRRVLILTAEYKAEAVRVDSIAGGEIMDVQCVELGDGCNDLWLSVPTRGNTLTLHEWHGSVHCWTLHCVPEVRRVEQIILDNLMTTDQKPETPAARNAIGSANPTP